MLARILLFLLPLILAFPATAACPLAQPQRVPDCCRKWTKCPKPVRVQPCFDCVADVRTAAALLQVQPATAAAPELAILSAAPAWTALETQTMVGTTPDQRSTYLRFGVLRI